MALQEDPDQILRERDDYRDRLLRSIAEFDNYRKRIERERRELAEFVSFEILNDLLPLVDDLERALAAAPVGDSAPTVASYRAGIELIYKQLAELLRKRNVTAIEAKGADFDPHVHQAVASEPSDSASRQRSHRGAAPRLPARRAPAPARDGEGGLAWLSRLLRGPGRRALGRRTGRSRAPTASWRSSTTPIATRATTRAEEQVQGSGGGLRDPRRRRQAGRLRSLRPRRRQPGGPAQGFDPSVFSDFGDILGGLGDIFGFGDAFGGRRAGPRRGADLRYDLEIAFEAAAKGTETQIRIPREETCTTCKGSGSASGAGPETCPQCRGAGQVRYQQGFFTVAKTCGHCRGAGRIITKPCQTCRGNGRTTEQRDLKVKIPAGIATGQRLRLTGEGEHGVQGGPPGDLYIVVIVADHPFFQRHDDDLHCELRVPFTTLALGGSVQVPTLDGDERCTCPTARRAAPC